MAEKKIKVLVVFPDTLLKKVDKLAKKEKLDRSAFVCRLLESKIFADEMREAYRES